jgi:hypothetical protein
MYTLIINGKTIEGLDVVRLTKAVNDIGNLPTRQGGYSNTLDIPATKNNLEALGMIENINSLDKTPERVTLFDLYDDFILVARGVIKIIAIKESIQLALLSDNSDWTVLISDKKLNDINTDAIDYILSESATAARRLKTDEYILPNVWYGGWFDSARPYDVLDFQPAFYAVYILERIFTDVGYSVIFDLSGLAGNILGRTVILQTKNEWQYKTNGLALDVELFAENNIPDPAYFGGDFVRVVTPTTQSLGGFPPTGKQWSSITSPTLSAEVDIAVTDKYFNNVRGYVDIEVVGASITGSQPQIIATNTDATPQVIGVIDVPADGTYRMQISTENVVPITNTTLLFPEIATNADLSCTINILGGRLFIEDSDIDSAQQFYTPFNDFISHLQGALPDVSQVDFLLTIFNQFGIITTTDVVARTVRFQQLDTIINNIPRALNWTDKIDLSEEPEIIFNFWDKYYQRNIFQYAPDDADARLKGLNIGVGEITFDNTNQPPVGVLFESAFSPTARGEELVPPLAACEWRFYATDLNPKLGVVEITTNNLITQFGQSAPTQSAEVFFDEISFKNLINQNYNALKRILQSNRALKLLLRLTRTDFDTIDFTVPIYLNVNTQSHGQIVGHFYVNEIDQWQSGESCYVTLIKID